MRDQDKRIESWKGNSVVFLAAVLDQKLSQLCLEFYLRELTIETLSSILKLHKVDFPRGRNDNTL